MKYKNLKIGELQFKNPVLVASGTFGYGEEMSEFYDLSKLGGIITKTVTLEPREGNPPPRIWEVPSGLLNSIGLANVGLENFINDKLPYLAMIDTNIIANVAGFSVEEFGVLVEELDKYDTIKAFELNLSCPNVKEGGKNFATDKNAIFEITRLCRVKTDKPIIVKLSPNVEDISEMAVEAEKAGADAVSMINTVVGMAIDIKNRSVVFKNKVAGLSGPAIRPIGIRCVYQTFEKVSIPILGIGGIDSLEAALEYIFAGATFIQIGTYNFIDPLKPLEIIVKLEEYLEEHNEEYETLIGVAH